KAYGRQFKAGERIDDYESFEPRVRRALEGSGKVGTRPVEAAEARIAELEVELDQVRAGGEAMKAELEQARARTAELQTELEHARSRIAELEALLEKPAERVKPPGPADRAEAAEPSKRRQR